MAAIDMTELQYAARGRTVVPGAPIGGVPGHILGMTSTVRGSIHKVHTQGAPAAVAHATTKFQRYLAGAGSPSPSQRGNATVAQNYLDCVRQYAAWDTASGLIFRHWQLQSLVSYSATDIVDALVRVVLADGSGKITGRVVIWDTEPVTGPVAETIAAVAVEVLDTVYSATDVDAVEVWQLRDGIQHRVGANAARAARNQAAALVSSL